MVQKRKVIFHWLAKLISIEKQEVQSGTTESTRILFFWGDIYIELCLSLGNFIRIMCYSVIKKISLL